MGAHSHFCLSSVHIRSDHILYKTCSHGYSEIPWLYSAPFHSLKPFAKRFWSQFWGVVKHLGEVLFLESVS